jgi:hypothetical protein
MIIDPRSFPHIVLPVARRSVVDLDGVALERLDALGRRMEQLMGKV